MLIHTHSHTYLQILTHTHTFSHIFTHTPTSFEQLREDLGYTREKNVSASNPNLKAMNVDDILNEVQVACRSSVHEKCYTTRFAFFLLTIFAEVR